jgi:carbon monoxide dehydrogenase subunit G
MKLHEEFRVDEPVATVWEFFEQPEAVAKCVPGVEHVSVLDQDNVTVRATQKVGPMTATFEAKITVVERVANELIRFNAVGKSVKGAIGNVRTSNSVSLQAADAGTVVTVEGDVVLAGALGSVGQKVVAKQAGKVTAEFAGNLQRALSGEPAAPAPVSGPGDVGATTGEAPSRAPQWAAAVPAAPAAGRGADPWSRVAAALSAVTAAISIVLLVRDLRRPR